MNLFKLMGSLKNLSGLEAEMKTMAAELANKEFEGRAGGDMVIVRVNGSMQLVSCTMDPSLVGENDREMVEELVVAASNDALSRARQYSAKAMQERLSSVLGIPGLDTILGPLLK